MELPLSEFANRISTIQISQMSRFDNFLLQILVKINSLDLYVTQILNYSKNHQLCMDVSPPWLKPRRIILNPIQTDSRYPVTLSCYYKGFLTDIKCHITKNYWILRFITVNAIISIFTISIHIYNLEQYVVFLWTWVVKSLLHVVINR